MTDDSKIPYPYMPEGRSIILVPEDNQFMKLALEARKKSNDALISTGIVAVKDGKVIGSDSNKAGYNNKLLIKWHQIWMCPRRWFKAKTGQKYWLCPGCATYQNHAESRLVNSFDKNAKLSDLKDADIYLAGHWWCCKPCWDNIIRAEVKNIFLMEGAKERFDSRNW